MIDVILTPLLQMYSSKSFTFSMTQIRQLWGEPSGMDLLFIGSVTDYYYLETYTGTALAHVIKDGIKLKVLGRRVRTFKPGVPFNIQVRRKFH